MHAARAFARPGTDGCRLPPMEAGAREQWSGRTTFVRATVASAVGLVNIWRFAYVAGESGGRAFLVAYLVAVALLGLPLMLA